MVEKSEELKIVEHLHRIMNNLGEYWHSIQLLLSHVSKPLLVDDRGLAMVLQQLTEKITNITIDMEQLDISKTLAEIKYIGNRLNKIEKDISAIKDEGIKKNIHLALTCDGYEMRKKINPFDKMLEDEKKVDPAENIKLLLGTLTAREASVISHRLGLLGESKKTWENVGKEINLGKERARVIYNKALRILRHSSRRHLVESITHIALRKEIIGD